MSYHGYTLQKYNDKIEAEDKLTDEIIKVLEEIEEKYPNILPDNEDTCFKVGYEIVMNDYDIDCYMKDYIEEHSNNEEN